METKTIAAVELKDADKGKVLLRFATLDVMDRDGDIIKRGAIGKQRVKVSSYGHDAMFGGLPIGGGTTKEVGDEAQAEIQLFLDTPRGRDTFTVLKEFGEDQEWSFGYEVKEWAAPSEEERQRGVYRILKRLEVFEVSPVMRGAGVATATLSAKDAARKAPEGMPPPSDGSPPAPDDTAQAAAAADAEAKAAQDAAADRAAQADADAKAAATVKNAAAEEFERFQRTLRRFQTT